jgi:hypothetical protein
MLDGNPSLSLRLHPTINLFPTRVLEKCSTVILKMLLVSYPHNISEMNTVLTTDQTKSQTLWGRIRVFAAGKKMAIFPRRDQKVVL